MIGNVLDNLDVRPLSRKRVAFRIAFSSKIPTIQSCVELVKSKPRNNRSEEVRKLLILTELVHRQDISDVMNTVTNRARMRGIRKRVVDHIAKEIISVQPMPAPASQIFTLRQKYGDQFT